MNLKIICDDRERHLHPFLEKYTEEYKIDHEIKRINIGDYAIELNEKIRICIERKTWQDLAASMRDGRKGNIEKLLWLREKTNCVLIYIIEGTYKCFDNNVVSAIPVKHLISHLDHLMIRDLVHIIYTRSTDETAHRIFELAKNLLTIREPPAPVTGAAQTTTDTDTDTDTDTAQIKDSTLLNNKFESNVAANEMLLRTLPAIGSIISSLLAINNVNLHTILNKSVAAEQMALFKYDSGKCIGLSKAKKIYDLHKILDADSKSCAEYIKKIHIRLLSNVPHISKKSAKYILGQISIKDIMRGADLTEIKYTDAAKLTKKRIENIKNYFAP